MPDHPKMYFLSRMQITQREACLLPRILRPETVTTGYAMHLKNKKNKTKHKDKKNHKIKNAYIRILANQNRNITTSNRYTYRSNILRRHNLTHSRSAIGLRRLVMSTFSSNSIWNLISASIHPSVLPSFHHFNNFSHKHVSRPRDVALLLAARAFRDVGQNRARILFTLFD